MAWGTVDGEKLKISLPLLIATHCVSQNLKQKVIRKKSIKSKNLILVDTLNTRFDYIRKRLKKKNIRNSIFPRTCLNVDHHAFHSKLFLKSHVVYVFLISICTYREVLLSSHYPSQTLSDRKLLTLSFVYFG